MLGERLKSYTCQFTTLRYLLGLPYCAVVRYLQYLLYSEYLTLGTLATIPHLQAGARPFFLATHRYLRHKVSLRGAHGFWSSPHLRTSACPGSTLASLAWCTQTRQTRRTASTADTALNEQANLQAFGFPHNSSHFTSLLCLPVTDLSSTSATRQFLAALIISRLSKRNVWRLYLSEHT